MSSSSCPASLPRSPRWCRTSKVPSFPRSTLYHKAKTDPTFPKIHSVSKRVSLIDLDELDAWIKGVAGE